MADPVTLKPEASSEFLPFTERFEGKCGWMYLDILGLVTTGRGNLIDPKALALALPWTRAGEPAECHEIGAEWSYVKGLQERRKLGGGAFAGVTSLRLSDAAIDALTNSKRDALWAQLIARFAWLAAAPWQVQLVLLSMAWAMGAEFRFPHFQAAAALGDWRACAGPPGDADAYLSCRGEAWIRDGLPGQTKANENPGLRPRNLANKALLEQVC